MSADGEKHTAVVYGGRIYISDKSYCVGIETTNPDAKLDVRGLNEAVRASYTTSAWIQMLYHSSRGPLLQGDGYPKLTLDADAGAAGMIILGMNGDSVGIGTTTPNGILDVNGPIYQRGGLLHADYVFEPEYVLESIDEHSEFMWQNKHLAAIPEVKVDESGREIIEVGAYRRGIVEELEKAHIYIEQLYKHNKALEERVAALEKLIIQQRFITAKAHFLAKGPLQNRDIVIWGAGPIGRRISRHLLRAEVPIRFFVDVDRRKIGRTLRGRPIVSADDFPLESDDVVLAAVGSRHARELIRRRLVARFLVEGRDFFCVA